MSHFAAEFAHARRQSRPAARPRRARALPGRGLAPATLALAALAALATATPRGADARPKRNEAQAADERPRDEGPRRSERRRADGRTRADRAASRTKREGRRRAFLRALAALPPPWRGEVYIVGSSSIRNELGAEIELDLRALGFDAVRHGVSGTGLTRPDRYDWFATSAWLPISSRTLAVVLYLGVNDGQSIHMVGKDWLPGMGRPPGKGETLQWDHPRWSDEYLRRFVAFVDSFCRRGARDVFVLLPVDVKGNRLDEKLERIRALQVEGVRWSQCGRALDTRGDMAWIKGPGERVAARRRRDGFHMTTAGAHIVWERVRDQVIAILDRLDGTASRRLPRTESAAMPAGAVVPNALQAPHPPPARR